MRVPFHTLGTSFHPVHAVATFPAVLDEPVVRMQPLYDTVGIPYAYDLILTDGFLVTVVAFALVRTLVRTLARIG